MDTTTLKAASAAAKWAARTDAKIRKKLLKRARKHDMTEAEKIELAETWKHAARSVKHQHLGSGRHKAHQADEGRPGVSDPSPWPSGDRSHKATGH
jgi:hypothetical protein